MSTQRHLTFQEYLDEERRRWRIAQGLPPEPLLPPMPGLLAVPTGTSKPPPVPIEERYRQFLEARGVFDPEAPRQGVSLADALGNIGRVGPATLAEFMPGRTGREFRELRGQVGPLEAIRRLDEEGGAFFPSVKVPDRVQTAVQRALRRQIPEPFAGKIAEAITPEQLGLKGALEAFAQPDILLPAARMATKVVAKGAEVAVRAAPAVGRAATQAAEKAAPAARRLAMEEAGAIRPLTPGISRPTPPKPVAIPGMPGEPARPLTPGVSRPITTPGRNRPLSETELRLQALGEQLAEAEGRLEMLQSGGANLVKPPKTAPGGIGSWSAARLKALAIHEGLDYRQADWWDSIDPVVVKEMRTAKVVPEPTVASLNREIRTLRMDIAQAEANVPPQVGNIQAGMGIGERPAQGGLFENLQGQADKIPLADAEQMALRQQRAAQIAAGQAEMPVAVWTREQERSLNQARNRLARANQLDMPAEAAIQRAEILRLSQLRNVAGISPDVAFSPAPMTERVLPVRGPMEPIRQEVPLTPVEAEDLVARRVQHPLGGKKPYYRVYRSDGVVLGGAESRAAALANAKKSLQIFREHPEWDVAAKVTEPVASEGISPAAKAAQATEGVKPGGPLVAKAQAEAQANLAKVRAEWAATHPSPKAPVGAEPPLNITPGQAPTGVTAAADQGNLLPGSAAPPIKPPIEPPRRPLWADIPPEPAREPSRMPPVGEKLPSGRRPGGPERMKPSAPSDNYARLQGALASDKEPVVARLRVGLNTFMERFSDRNHAFWQLQKDTGIPVHDLAQVVPGSTAAGQDIVRRLTYPIYSTLGKDVKFLEEYMVLLRADDILALNPAARLPGGIEGAAGLRQAKFVLEKKVGPERLEAIRNAANQLWAVNDEQVRMALVREGIITKAARNAMNADHPHYIPFQRADFTDALAEGMASPEASVSSTGILKMAVEGSERALSDPLVRMDAQIIKTQQVIFRNRAAKAVVQSLIETQNATGQELVRFIEPKRTLNIAGRVTGAALPRAPKGEHSKLWETISYFDNGEKVTVEVPAIYGRVAKGMDGEAGGLLSQVARAVNAPLRHGAVTYNPAFLIINPLRDATSAFWRERLIPFSPEYFKGWSAVIQKNATFEEAAQSGALLSGIVDTMKSTQALSRAKDIGNLTVRNPKDALLLIPRLLARMNITAEQATRVAVFRKARIEGADALTSAVKARNATVDFAKMGTTMRIINDVYPFSNAALQGIINTAAIIRSNPKWAAIAATPFVALTVMSRINNMRFETSEQIPDYWYGSYWVFQFAEGTRPDGAKFPIYFKMPKGPVGSLLTFPGEALFNAVRPREDRSSVELLLQAGIEATKSTSPVEPTFGGVVPTAAGQTLAGLATGVDLYRGQPIVPAREEQLLPEQQFGPETSKTAIALGTRFTVSPRLIDFAINDYLAGGGQTSNWMLSAALDAVGYKPEPFGAAQEEAQARRLIPIEQISKAPVTGRFLGTTGTQLERRGWEQFREAITATNQEFSRIPGMNSLGIRLGSVSDSIDVTPYSLRMLDAKSEPRQLTPAERAQYQTLMASHVIAGLTEFVRLWDARQRQIGIQGQVLSPLVAEAKRKAMMEKMGSLKDEAREAFKVVLRQAPLNKPVPGFTPTPALLTPDSQSMSPYWFVPPKDDDFSDAANAWRREHATPEPAGAR